MRTSPVKIARRLRDIHQDCTELYTLLSKQVRELLGTKVEEQGWFFLHRLKQLESFALKIETGRVPDPGNLEDFFACTIVVPTIREVQEAEELVCEYFEFDRRRPPEQEKTQKSSSSFVFDDLRLYVKHRPLKSGLHPRLDGLVFEVQIKTILQHAWSLATHDLIYKTDSVSWPLERIAFQVKAMLEHAEVAIDKAEQISKAPAVAKSDRETTAVRKLIRKISRTWPADRLPSDVKRLAENILNILELAGLSENDFRAIIASEEKRSGPLPTNLSPYAYTLQALSHYSGIDLRRKFNRSREKRAIVVHDDMDLPQWMLRHHERIVRV